MTTIAYNTKTHHIAYRFGTAATVEDFNAAGDKVPFGFVESLANLPIAEQVKLFNKLTGQGVKKFSTKAEGVERLGRAMDEFEVPYWESAMKPEKTAGKKTTGKKAAGKKAEKPAKERKLRHGAAQFIRDALAAGGDDIDLIIRSCQKELPKVKVTRGYVRWIARGIGRADQVPVTVGRPPKGK